MNCEVQTGTGANQLESITKKIQLKSRGKVFGVVRENYLRTDIPCRSPLCFDDSCSQTELPKNQNQSTLPADVTHYIIPFVDVASKFMEIFELNELSGVIFPQTIVNIIQQNSLKHYRRICSFIREPKNSSIFFPNEFFKPTYLQRETSESILEWQSRMIFRVGCWYYEHLAGQIPIVLLTEDPDVIKSLSAERLEVFVMSMPQYLDMFWTHLHKAADLLKSIELAAANPVEDRTKEFTEYYKPDVLEAGLRSGKFISGRLNVNKHLALTEAFVARGSVHEAVGEAGGEILISGAGDRNRAVDGDLVVVEILAKSEWKSRGSRLVELDEKEKDGEGLSWDRGADVMTTGRVVGVLERNWGHYIASLPRYGLIQDLGPLELLCSQVGGGQHGQGRWEEDSCHSLQQENSQNQNNDVPVPISARPQDIGEDRQLASDKSVPPGPLRQCGGQDGGARD